LEEGKEGRGEWEVGSGKWEVGSGKWEASLERGAPRERAAFTRSFPLPTSNFQPFFYLVK